MSELLLRRRNLLIRKQEEEMNIRAVCFKADGEQTVTITKVGSAPAITMQYSYDGVNWDAWDLSALPFGGSTKVYVRGVGNARLGTDSKNYNKITFGTDSYVYVSGVLEALLDGENEVQTYTYAYILSRLFHGQTALRSVENLRFEAQSSIAANVYSYMFYGCSNLLYAPKSLSIESFSGGYECAYMFSKCTSLIKAPKLPATTLSTRCYQRMFGNCTSLVSAPELNATTLANYCYEYMFSTCTSIVDAPELPATNLATGCYQVMFGNCKSLKTIRCHAKVTASNAVTNWATGITTSGTLYGHSEYGWSSGASGIPTTWTFEELTD